MVGLCRVEGLVWGRLDGGGWMGVSVGVEGIGGDRCVKGRSGFEQGGV